MSNVPCKSLPCLCPPSSQRPHYAGVKCVHACLCVFARQGLTAAHLASQWTMELQLRLGSAQMSLHSHVSWRVTLFPVTFSAINLQTYSDGVPLWGYIVLMSHHFLDGTEVVQPVWRRCYCRMIFGFNSISCRRRLLLSYWPFFHDFNRISWMMTDLLLMLALHADLLSHFSLVIVVSFGLTSVKLTKEFCSIFTVLCMAVNLWKMNNERDKGKARYILYVGYVHH